MSTRLFGTDGIRGAFGEPPLDEPTVRRLGATLGRRLGRNGGKAPHVILGGDTRASTPTLCRWLAAGLAAEGVRITFLGTLPTPGIAWVARRMGADTGIAVSASHNPLPDNGIKLIDGQGFKWAPEAEMELEEGLRGSSGGDAAPPPDLVVDDAAVASYFESLHASALATSDQTGTTPLTGLAVALDGAHGAASAFAVELFTGLGARVTATCVDPDGTNINEGCGSTHPQRIAELTRDSASDLGFAFDGDADRVVLADEGGEIRDGDAILYLWARDLADRGELTRRRIVATSMSNLGLEAALGRKDIAVERCGVGDREVVQTLRDEGLVLGGEQSGHIVHLGLGTTGDGLLTALQMAALARRAGRPLSRLLAGLERYPQLIRNVRVRHKPDLDSLPRVCAARDQVLRQLDGEGRLVLRYSGTEPLARIMIEGRDRRMIENLAETLAAAIAEELK